MTASTRRAAVGAILAIPLAPMSAVSADADLLALGAALEEAWAAERAVYARWRAVDTAEADRDTSAASGTTDLIVRRIEALSATTLAGLIVKARVVSWCHDGAPFDDRSFGTGATDERIVSGILNDLLSLGGLVA